MPFQAPYSGHNQVRLIERGAKRMRQDVAELATFVNRAGRVRPRVAGDTTRRRKLAKEAAEAGLVTRDMRVDFRIRSFQVGVRHHRGATMSRPGQEQHVQVVAHDQPVEVGVQQVQPRRRAPVPQQPGFDVLGAQWLAQERVVLQIDLSNCQVVGSTKIGVDFGGAHGEVSRVSGGVLVRGVES
jgi:hypothetical protein